MPGAHRPGALHQVRTAVLANMKPGLVLWCGLVLLLMAYLWSPAVQSGLAQWGALKQAWGYPGAFVTYAAFAVLVPELLAIAVAAPAGAAHHRARYAVCDRGVRSDRHFGGRAVCRAGVSVWQWQ